MNNELDIYLANAEQRKQQKAERGEVIELTVPTTAATGLKWKLLPIRPEQFAISGRVPMHLIGKLRSVRNLPPAEIEKRMSADEMEKIGFAALEFTRDIMLSNLVFPKVSLEPAEGCITPEQIDPEDFSWFLAYCCGGGQAEANIKSKKTSRKRI